MTFALYCHKRSRMAIQSLNLALGYAMEVAVGTEDIVRTTENDSTDERGFGNLIQTLEA